MVKSSSYVPDPGDIVLVDLNPVKGSEQSGYRPALVISLKKYNALSGMCVIVPITSKKKGYLFELDLEQRLATKGVILCDHVRSVCFTKRSFKFVEKVSSDFLKEVIAYTKALFP